MTFGRRTKTEITSGDMTFLQMSSPQMSSVAWEICKENIFLLNTLTEFDPILNLLIKFVNIIYSLKVFLSKFQEFVFYPFPCFLLYFLVLLSSINYIYLFQCVFVFRFLLCFSKFSLRFSRILFCISLISTLSKHLHFLQVGICMGAFKFLLRVSEFLLSIS